jgi:hypothetical protein
LISYEYTKIFAGLPTAHPGTAMPEARDYLVMGQGIVWLDVIVT